MLEGLVETIEILQERIRNHGEKIGKNEFWTRVALIDPLLSALGWDPCDPARVEIEPKVHDGWADYALLGANGQRLLFIEAKRAGDPKPATLQTASYAFTYNSNNAPKVGHCAWTNGKEWVVWDVFSADKVLETSLPDEEPAECAFALSGLWRRSCLHGAIRRPVEPVLDPGGRGQSPPPPDSLWTALDSPELETTKGPPPREIRFPDGATVSLKYWFDVFGRTADWLYGRGLLTGDNAKGIVGGRTPLFGRDGVRFDGKELRKAERVGGSDLHFEAHAPAREHVKKTILLLRRLHQDPAAVTMRPAEKGS